MPSAATDPGRHGGQRGGSTPALRHGSDVRLAGALDLLLIDNLAVSQAKDLKIRLTLLHWMPAHLAGIVDTTAPEHPGVVSKQGRLFIQDALLRSSRTMTLHCRRSLTYYQITALKGIRVDNDIPSRNSSIHIGP